MSAGVPCRCQPPDRSHWRVIDRNCNRSAFNGYRWAWSAYSSVQCRLCGGMWRTKAAYVRGLPDVGSK
jgi:hypothetical protein